MCCNWLAAVPHCRSRSAASPTHVRGALTSCSMTTTLAENTARFKATPPPRSLLHSGKPHKIAAFARFCMRAAAAVRQPGSARGCTRIAFVGDVHGDWSAKDEAALRFLDVGATKLFAVGQCMRPWGSLRFCHFVMAVTPAKIFSQETYVAACRHDRVCGRFRQ